MSILKITDRDVIVLPSRSDIYQCSLSLIERLNDNVFTFNQIILKLIHNYLGHDVVLKSNHHALWLCQKIS